MSNNTKPPNNPYSVALTLSQEREEEKIYEQVSYAIANNINPHKNSLKMKQKQNKSQKADSPLPHIPSTLTSAEVMMRYSKRAKILGSIQKSEEMYGEIRDGDVDDASRALNQSLILHKDTVLMNTGKFPKKHLMPVVYYSVAWSTDNNYIVKTASVIGSVLEKLQMRMLEVLDDIKMDSGFWKARTYDEMEDLLKCDEFVQLTNKLKKYDGISAIQVFNMRYLGNLFGLTKATLVKLFYQCTQSQVRSLTFLPNLETKTFKFRVSFLDDHCWELDVEGVDNVSWDSE